MKTTKWIMALAGVVGLSGGVAVAEDWPRLSGPHTNWTSNDRGLIDALSKDGPKVAWEAKDLGGGFGSPVVAAGRVFVIGRPMDTRFKAKDGNPPIWNDAKCLPGPDVLSCLDRNTGAVLWKHEFNSLSNTASTAWNTPTVDGDVLYARGGDGQVRCISVKDGTVVWAWPKEVVSFKAQSGHKMGLASRNGSAASIAICDDVLPLMAATANGHSVLVGLDRKTGEKLWETPEFGDWQFGDRNHVILDLGKKKVVLTHYMVLDGKTGQKLGTYTSPPSGFHSEWCSAFEGNRYFAAICFENLDPSSPFYLKQHGHGQGIECLEFTLKDDGTVTHTSKWQWLTNSKDRWGKVIEKGFSGPLLVGGYLYVPVGYKGHAFNLVCLDTSTGQQTWADIATPPDICFSCLLYADGKIFYLTEQGVLVMLAADPKQYRLLGTAKVVGRTWASLALSDGFVFARDDTGVLKCMDVRATK